MTRNDFIQHFVVRLAKDTGLRYRTIAKQFIGRNGVCSFDLFHSCLKSFLRAFFYFIPSRSVSFHLSRLSYFKYLAVYQFEDGQAAGEARGRAEGRAEGAQAKAMAVAHHLLPVLDDAAIATATGLTTAEVARLRQELG